MHKLKTCGKNQATKECTEGFQRAIGKPFGRARRRDSPVTRKIKQHKCALRSSPEGDRKAPLSPPQRRNPCVREKTFLIDSTTMSERPAVRSRPSGATQHRCWKEQLGGASEEAQSYWQGRFAACALVEHVWHTGRPWNCWGVAPNPTRGAASGLRKGEFPP